MTMTHALDMPEIRESIIQFLLSSRNDLLACLLLSHSWYSSIQPWLWRHLYLYSELQPTRLPRTKAPFPQANLQNPPVLLLGQNAVFIRHLHVKAPIDSRLLATLNHSCLSDSINNNDEGGSNSGRDLASSLSFPVLETLHIHGYCCDETVIDLEIRFAARLIRHTLGQTATLKELHLSSLPSSSVTALLHALDDNPSPSGTSSTSTSTSTPLPKHPLDRLRLTDLTLPYNLAGRTQFWQHCTSIRRFEFDNVNCLSYPCPSNLIFPRLEHLQLTNMSLLTSYEQLQLMSQCPNLTSLEWGPPSSTTVNHISTTPSVISPAELSNRIAQISLSPISKVHTLTLRGSRTNDASIAKILSGCEPLRKLNVHGSGFAQESIDMLAARHFASLRVIDMGDCQFVTSPMVALILDQCPLLEVLVAPTLKVGDIMTNNSGAGLAEIKGCAGQKEWVCKDLRVLEVQIEIETTRIDLERPFINARLEAMKKLTTAGRPRLRT
ncbi:hypothetical protein BG015_012085 [Linnemannia schmuckeri]|uniref:F-box domain-containing protein n=1 Tax=Linnemannia schmuckeri TaxID=64567 RepID=A0A9P5S834_9FUNG|nr:hypothetical protein BG015_012085 [Linnemannia schmuckeri]